MIDIAEFLTGLVVVVTILLVIAVGGWVSSYKCETAWERSGLKSEWGFIQGCLVQRKDGTWVPQDVVKDVNQ